MGSVLRGWFKGFTEINSGWDSPSSVTMSFFNLDPILFLILDNPRSHIIISIILPISRQTSGLKFRTNSMPLRKKTYFFVGYLPHA